MNIYYYKNICLILFPSMKERRSSTETNKDRDMPSNPAEEKKFQYPMERKKNHSNPTEERMTRREIENRSNLPVEADISQCCPLQRKKDLELLPCPLCDNNRLRQLIRLFLTLN